VLVVTRPETRELEHQHANFLPNVFAWFQKRCGEQIGIQKIGIRLTGLCAEPVEIRKTFDCERISHLEADAKIIRHLVCQTLKVFATREIVIRGIHANRFEDLGILRQAISLEAGFSESIAEDVAPLVVTDPLLAVVVEPERQPGVDVEERRRAPADPAAKGQGARSLGTLRGPAEISLDLNS